MKKTKKPGLTKGEKIGAAAVAVGLAGLFMHKGGSVFSRITHMPMWR